MKKLLFLIIIVIKLFLCTHTTIAQWSNNPNINTPICTATNNQSWSQLISDGSGGAIICWYDYRNGTNNADIYTQRINSSGQIQWTNNGVAVCTATNDQMPTHLISDGSGGAIICWYDFRSGTNNADIYTQRINSSGQIQWTNNGVAVCTAINMQQNAQLISDGLGGAIICWFDYRNGTNNADIYTQRINSSGQTLWTNNGVAVCTATNEQWLPQLISDGYGGAIICWDDRRNGNDSNDIYAQRINSSGQSLWTNNGVAVCTAINKQRYAQLISDGYGGAIICWDDRRNGTNNADIYTQRINTSGQTLWTNNGVAVCTATDNQILTHQISDGSGGAIICWYDYRNGSDNYDIYAQRINSSGQIQWANNGVAVCTATNEQWLPIQISDGYGGAIICWDDRRNGTNNADIYTQRINTSGQTLWTNNGVAVCTATNEQSLPKLISDGSGGAIICWPDGRNGNSNYDIYIQNVNSDGSLGNSKPIVTTVGATNITDMSAILAGSVTSTGGSILTARGICYDTLQNPSVAGLRTIDTGQTGSFSDTVRNLKSFKTYYYKAYAINSADTAYGDQKSFKTKGLKILEPLGGEKWVAGSVHKIEWEKSDISNVKIEYKDSSESNWSLLEIINDSSKTSTNWPLPDKSLKKCQIRITNVSDSTIKAETGYFRVYKPTLTLNEFDYTIQFDSTMNIIWTASDIDSIKIEYTNNFKDTLSKWNLIKILNPDVNMFDWKVPDDLSTNCRIRLTDISSVRDTKDSGIYVISDKFRIVDKIDYLPSNDGFAFENNDANMWPSSWWSSINYQDTNHQVTFGNYLAESTVKLKYPLFKPIVQNYWYTGFDDFSFAFGQNVIDNINGQHVYINSKVEQWGCIARTSFYGACFGLVYTSILNKAGYCDNIPAIKNAAGDNLFNKGYFSTNGKLNNNVRSAILGAHTFQFSQENKQYLLKQSTLDFSTKIWILRTKFGKIRSDKSEYKILNPIAIYQSSTGHELLPYMITKDLDSSFYRIYVYDCNEPGDDNLFIEIDTIRNQWNYSIGSWSWYGPDGFKIDEPPGNYINHWASKTKAKGDFIQADTNRLEIYFNSQSVSNGPDVKIKDKSNGQFANTGHESNTIPQSYPITATGGAKASNYIAPLLGLYIDDTQSSQYSIEFTAKDVNANHTIFTMNDDYSVSNNWKQDDLSGNKRAIYYPGQKKFTVQSSTKMSMDNFSFMFNNETIKRQSVIDVSGLKLNSNDSLIFKNMDKDTKFSIQSFGQAKSYSIKFDNILDNLEFKGIKFNNNKEQHIYTIKKWDSLDISDIILEIDTTGDNKIDSVINLTEKKLTFVTQPDNISKCIGEDCQLEVSMKSNQPDSLLQYQWMHNGEALSESSRIIGTKTNKLELKGLDAGDAGLYTVKVSIMNSNVSKTSNNAMMTVNVKPSITENLPSEVILSENDSLILNVNSDGTPPLNYQWYKDENKLDNETGSSLKIQSVRLSDSGEYYCELTNMCGTVNSQKSKVSITVTLVNDATNDYFRMSVRPNPAFDQVNISCELLQDGYITLSLADNNGKQIREIVNGYNIKGNYNYTISRNHLNLASGSYYIIMSFNKLHEVKKVLYIN